MLFWLHKPRTARGSAVWAQVTVSTRALQLQPLASTLGSPTAMCLSFQVTFLVLRQSSRSHYDNRWKTERSLHLVLRRQVFNTSHTNPVKLALSSLVCIFLNIHTHSQKKTAIPPDPSVWLLELFGPDEGLGPSIALWKKLKDLSTVYWCTALLYWLCGERNYFFQRKNILYLLCLEPKRMITHPR